MTDRSPLGRAAQCFEARNAPDMRRDRRRRIVDAILSALVPALLIAAIAIAAWFGMHIATRAAALTAAPMTPPY